MNRGKNYKDKEKWRKTCTEQKRRYYGKTAFRYERRFWTFEEDKAVLQQNMTDYELSQKIQRSVAAIQMRRHKLKKFAILVEC